MLRRQLTYVKSGRRTLVKLTLEVGVNLTWEEEICGFTGFLQNFALSLSLFDCSREQYVFKACKKMQNQVPVIL